MKLRRALFTISTLAVLTAMMLLLANSAEAMPGGEVNASVSRSMIVARQWDGAGLTPNGWVGYLGPDAPPVIEVWYGPYQVFGTPGKPQQWINILGNVSDPAGIKSLVYSLNGGDAVPLTIGPDGRRLEDQGDFNVDIDYADLQNGENTVVITATDQDDNEATETVTVAYAQGNVWPGDYSVNWSSVSDVQNVVQVVDGLWGLEGDTIRTHQTGYDRLVAIGDASWNDYEVAVPVTIRSTTSTFAGVGILMRWTGHTDDPISGRQPKTGWWPFGALGWYRWTTSYPQGRLQLEGNQGHLIDWDNSGQRLEYNVPYIFKMRVETGVGQVPWYGLKVWKAGNPEPAEWVLSGQEGADDPQHGSFLLLAHHVDANFGDVTVTSIREVCHSLSTAVGPAGSGSVNASPAPNCEGGEYRAGTTVQLTADPQPGYYFSHWSGDADGNGNPTAVTVDGDLSVTAHFTQECYSLTTSVDPGGSGSINTEPAPVCPGGLFPAGTQVRLTAQPASGYNFSYWSGDASGSSSQTTIIIDRDSSVTAHFSQLCYSLTTRADPGNGGSVSTDPAPNCGSNQYSAGTQVRLTAQPALGYNFSYWSGDASGSNSQTTIIVDRDSSVTAHFSDLCYNLGTVVSPSGSGSIDVDPQPNCSSGLYAAGTQVQLTATPASGYVFDSWSGSLSGLANPAALTMDGDAEAIASFSQKPLIMPHSVYVPLVQHTNPPH